MSVPGRGAQRRAFIGYQEARTQAILLAVVLWSAAAAATFLVPGERSATGRLKGGDFIQFYTLGFVAFAGDYPRTETANALHAVQAQLLPASDPELYLPVYPPQTALVFAPLARLPYPAAAIVWALLLVAGYAGIVWYTWRSARDVLTDRVFVAAAAAAFPAFWQLVLHGQTTLFPLAAFFLAWLALRRSRPFLAGLAIGLIAIKPQFGLVIAGVALAAGEWRLILGSVCAIAAQAAAVLMLMGAQAIEAYGHNLRALPRVESLLEPQPWQMHSLRVLTNLAPSGLRFPLWIVAAGAIVLAAYRTWRTRAPLEVRLGIVVLASVIADPHLIVYDAAVLCLPLIWFGAWVERRHLAFRTEYWHLVYALFVTLLLPTARVLRVQLSVLIMLWLFWRVTRALIADGPSVYDRPAEPGESASTGGAARQ